MGDKSCTYHLINLNDKFVIFSRKSEKIDNQVIVPGVFLAQAIIKDLDRPISEEVRTTIFRKALERSSCEVLNSRDFKRIGRFKNRLKKDHANEPWQEILIIPNFQQNYGSQHCMISLRDTAQILIDECGVNCTQLPSAMFSDDPTSLFLPNIIFYGLASKNSVKTTIPSSPSPAVTPLKRKDVVTHDIASETRHTILNNNPAKKSKTILSIASNQDSTFIQPSTAVAGTNTLNSEVNSTKENFSQPSDLLTSQTNKFSPAIGSTSNAPICAILPTSITTKDIFPISLDKLHEYEEEWTKRLLVCKRIRDLALQSRKIFQEAHEIALPTCPLLSNVSKADKPTHNDTDCVTPTPLSKSVPKSGQLQLSPCLSTAVYGGAHSLDGVVPECNDKNDHPPKEKKKKKKVARKEISSILG